MFSLAKQGLTSSDPHFQNQVLDCWLLQTMNFGEDQAMLTLVLGLCELKRFLSKASVLFRLTSTFRILDLVLRVILDKELNCKTK